MATTRNWLAGGRLVPALVCVATTARLLQLHHLSDRLLTRALPDDAFYYLVLSRNFARTGRWTFDGVEPASGFHLLWGYLLAAIYRVAPAIDLHGIVLVAGVIEIVCVTLSAWLVCRTASRLFDREGRSGAQTGVAVILLSGLALATDLNLMETALALLVSAAVIDLLCRSKCQLTSMPIVAAVGLGMAGVLARSDFGLLPLCLLVAHLFLYRRGDSSRNMAWLAAAVFGGCLLGGAIVALHTHWVSGEWMQASGRIKLLWSSRLGFSTAAIRLLLFQFFTLAPNEEQHPRLLLRAAYAGSWLLLLTLLAGLLAALREGGEKPKALALRRGVAAAFCCSIAAYIFVYRYGGAAVQIWYVANLEMPLALLAGASASWFYERQRVLAMLVAAVACAFGIKLGFTERLTSQAPLYPAALYLAAHPELRPAGSWNAGILSYFGKGGVTNLDGLVNDRILPYAESGTLAEYVRRRQLHTLIDFDVWVTDDIGDPSGELRRCVVGQPMRSSNGTPVQSLVKVFVIDPQCLAAHQAHTK